MMYLSEMYQYASPYVWFTAAVFLIVLVSVLEKFRRRAVLWENYVVNEHISSKESATPGISLVECQSPNCVRCSKNYDVLQRARQRLSSYFIPADNAEIKNDVTNLSKDLKESLDAKSPSSETNEDKSSGHALQMITSTPTVFFMRGLRENAFFPAEIFPGLDTLEDRYDQIRLEFSHLYQSPLPETKSLWKINTTTSGKWEISHLINQGRMTKAGELCPLTMSILNHLSSFMKVNLFGNAAFSVVYPQTEITTHCGPTNFRIRCHLGLRVPSEACGLQVDDTSAKWKEGELVCFNDAFPHAVHHNGTENSGPRIVLLLDLWHPDVSKSQRKLLDYVFSPSG